MKEKFPLTPSGVDDKMEKMYAGDDASVEAEATAVETDPRQWILDSFVLEPRQVEYMDSLGSVFLADMGAALAYNFRHRYPVRLIRGDRQARSYKFIRKDQQDSVTYAPDQDPVEEGSLEIYIS